MIAILDYGSGNLFSVTNALRVIGAEFRVTKSHRALWDASKILLPGVGHFGQMMSALDQLDVRYLLPEIAVNGKQILGICLGMQVLFESSEEAPGQAGLGILSGAVHRFADTQRVPHMGWNEAAFGDSEPTWFYFANSFYVPVGEVTSAKTTYGETDFSAAVRKENVTGFQFHPEKSGSAGLALLKEWCEIAS